MQYRKKPVVIDAAQWDGTEEGFHKIGEALGLEKDAFNAYIASESHHLHLDADGVFHVQTFEGVMEVSKDDYVIKGIKGECYPCKPDIFVESYDLDQGDDQPDQGSSEKTLHNSSVDGATKNVKDIVFYGDGDMFKLLSKASSQSEGWMKSTKAMEIEGVGCLVQVTTQQRGLDGTYAVAEAVAMIHGVRIEETDGKNAEGKPNARKLVKR